MTLQVAPESLFWYWVNERHMIYVRRTAGLPKPWTQDPILRDYKFVNVFRELDAGTVWLREHFIERYDRVREHSVLPSLVLFNVCWYRMFNWRGTGAILGFRHSWDVQTVSSILEDCLRNHAQVFTGAHIVYSPPGQSKVDAIVDTCRRIFEKRDVLYARAREKRLLEETFYDLTRFPNVGPFMAYEMVTDLRHTSVLSDATDVNVWANVGPGAMRGLRRLDPKALPAKGLRMMRDLLGRSREMTGEHVPDMELRDVEHSLCEFDKYCRVKYGEGKPRSSYPGRA